VLHAAFSLLFTLVGVAALYVLLNADFLAVTQILVYVGGILILILFGVMLTHRVVKVEVKTRVLRTAPAAALAVLLAATLCAVFWSADWPLRPAHEAPPNTASIGEAFLTSHALPFEVASVVLLVALVGAVTIARRDTARSKKE
jgi:NADH-quinone oxidoreductase subunit J